MRTKSYATELYRHLTSSLARRTDGCSHDAESEFSRPIKRSPATRGFFLPFKATTQSLASHRPGPIFTIIFSVAGETAANSGASRGDLCIHLRPGIRRRMDAREVLSHIPSPCAS
jgi:hypothetical protein